MEWWKLFTAVYFSGVTIAMWKLWRPSLIVLQKVSPNNPLAIRPILSTFVVFLLFLVAFPFMIYAILFEDKANSFIENFLRGTLDDKQ
tara:strand:- start:93 stop:356 length:264 start_codon:yes stop_codon:yes gene_type:complete